MDDRLVHEAYELMAQLEAEVLEMAESGNTPDWQVSRHRRLAARARQRYQRRVRRWLWRAA